MRSNAVAKPFAAVADVAIVTITHELTAPRL
jgi:hypothetical protein